jgi:long-chain acyl-CoA synthetase
LGSNIEDIYHFISPKLLLSDSLLEDGSINRVNLSDIYGRACGNHAEEPEYEMPDENQVAEMLFTTGTTGRPKGGMLTFKNLYASTHNTWHGVNMEPEDIVLIPLPLNHSVGMRVTRTALYIGATIVIQNGFMFSKETRENIVEHGCTALVSVPASMELLYRNMGDNFIPTMGRLRYIEIGAGSLSYDMKEKLTAILPDTEIYNTWGSTETGGAIFLNVSKQKDKLKSMGKPASGIKIKVVDPEGNDISAAARDINTAGRMVLQGDMQMAGYYHMPEATAETLVDGWLYTNDLVYLDEDGFVYMLGRADDIINVGGEKVSPIEVENTASQYSGISDAACIGVPDPDGVVGQVPVLYVVPEAGYDEKGLIRFLASRLEAYKLPKQFISIQEIPRNRMKKLDRKALHKMYGETGKGITNEVVETILRRKSVRKFTDQDIPVEILETLIKVAIKAPSGHSMQTWHFSVVANPEVIEKIKETAARVADNSHEKIYGFNNPKVLILVSNDRRNENGIQDSACAVQNMMIAATSFGLGSVWINGLKKICDVPEMRELLASVGIPAKHTVWCTLALGYPDEKPKEIARKENVVTWIK